MSSYWQLPWLSLQWRHNGHDGVSNHKPHHCSLNRIFSRRSKKTSKLRFTGLCTGNSPVTSEFPAQMASNTENVSIWWCLHDECHTPRVNFSIWYNHKCKHVWHLTYFMIMTVQWQACLYVRAIQVEVHHCAFRAPFQYKHRLSQVWGFPC